MALLARKSSAEPKRPPKPTRRVKKLWRRHTWIEYQVPYDVVVAKDGTTGKPITRRYQATRYRRRNDGPSLRAWAAECNAPVVRGWRRRKGLV